MEPAYVCGTSFGWQDMSPYWDMAPLAEGQPVKLMPPGHEKLLGSDSICEKPLLGPRTIPKDPLTERPMPEFSPQPQTLLRASSPGGVLHVRWTVDARKLRGRDKIAVSPPFELDSPRGTFRLMLCPKAVSDRKGGASFQKAKGRGFVQVKCEAALGEATAGVLSLRISVDSGRPGSAAQEPSRGPVRHDFAQSGVCCHEEEWNFTQAVDEASQTFAVSVELLTQEAGPPGLGLET